MSEFSHGVIASVLVFLALLFGPLHYDIQDLKQISTGQIYSQDDIRDLENEAYHKGYANGYEDGAENYPSQNDYSQNYVEYTPQSDPSDPYANMTVYYTKSGKSFHLDADCFHIRNRDISASPMSDVINRLDPCHDCSQEVWDYYD